VILISLGGYLLKGSGIFFPSYFHPQVRNQRRFLLAFAESPGSAPLRGVVAQIKTNTAYPRAIAGKDYALPHSPVFYIPFTWFPREAQRDDEAMKHVALASAAAEVIVVFWLAGLVFGPRSGLAAALLAASLPPMHHLLLLAAWPAVTGHFFDTLAIAALVLLATDPRSLPALATFAGATATSFLLYFPNMLNLVALGAISSLYDRRLALRKLAVLSGAVVIPVAFFLLAFHRSRGKRDLSGRLVR
jgi:hypothetical protein